MQCLGKIVHGKAFQCDRRRNIVHRKVRRVHFHNSFGRGKPQASVARAPRRRMAVGRCLSAAQPVRGAKFNPVRAACPLHRIARARAVAARNPIAGGKPQMPVAIVQNCVDTRLVQTVMLFG